MSWIAIIFRNRNRLFSAFVLSITVSKIRKEYGFLGTCREPFLAHRFPVFLKESNRVVCSPAQFQSSDHCFPSAVQLPVYLLALLVFKSLQLLNTV